MDDAFSAVCENFRVQASFCKKMGSPFYADLLAELSKLITKDCNIGKVFSAWEGNPKSDAVALRCAAALHYLVITKQDAQLALIFPPKLEIVGQQRLDVLNEVIRNHEDLILEYLESPPQTNEVGRSVVLLGGFLEITNRFGPDIDIFEIGASAGLNMAFDQYYYQAENWHWGNPNSSVQFDPKWKGSPPPIGAINVHHRTACDLSPINPVTQKDRLLSYIWPDQIERYNRIRGAIEYAITTKPKIDTMEATKWLAMQHEEAPRVRPRVFYHSIIWQYFSARQQRNFLETMMELGVCASNTSPVVWLRLEPAKYGQHAELRMDIWPNHAECLLADSGFHGEWTNWYGA